MCCVLTSNVIVKVLAVNLELQSFYTIPYALTFVFHSLVKACPGLLKKEVGFLSLEYSGLLLFASIFLKEH